MNDAAKQWVAALRSGQWLQTRNALQRRDSDRDVMTFCCLGVACQLSKLGEWYDVGLFRDGSHQAEDAYNEERLLEGDEEPTPTFEEEFTSPDVQKWLGLKTKSGEFKTSAGERTSLATLNDAGASFEEIADYIEEYADQLFVAR